MLIGEVVHHLRSALDMLVRALAGRECDWHSEFPVCLDAEKYPGHESGRLRGLNLPPSDCGTASEAVAQLLGARACARACRRDEPHGARMKSRVSLLIERLVELVAGYPVRLE